jgi:NADH:ubiquinone oxidoreductase subunit 6 (subunit J)
MKTLTFIHYLFLVAAGLSAVGVVFCKNVFKAALLLLICLLSLAALYVLAHAEFIAITQVLIYAGGIMVVIVFGIMLTAKISDKPLQVGHTHLFGGILASLTTAGFLIHLISRYFLSELPPSAKATSNMETVGISLITDFLIPFEVAGILLLVALVGAAATVSLMKEKKT